MCFPSFCRSRLHHGMHLIGHWRQSAASIGHYRRPFKGSGICSQVKYRGSKEGDARRQSSRASARPRTRHQRRHHRPRGVQGTRTPPRQGFRRQAQAKATFNSAHAARRPQRRSAHFESPSRAATRAIGRSIKYFAALRIAIDLIDAGLCAHTAHRLVLGSFETYGEVETGIIVLPL